MNRFNRYKSQKIIRYEEDFVYSRRFLSRKKLSDNVIAILFTDCSIRREMSKEDISDYLIEISNYDIAMCKKKIKALCNKIGNKTYKKISQKLQIILNHQRFEQLYEFVINSIIETSMDLLVSLDKNSKNQFKQLKCYADVTKLVSETKSQRSTAVKVIQKFFDSIKQLNIDSSQDLEVYSRNKKKFVNFFVYAAALHELKFFPFNLVKKYSKFLEEKVLNSKESFNDTYITALCAVNMNVKKEFLQQRNISVMLEKGNFSCKSKFDLFDLRDKINNKPS